MPNDALAKIRRKAKALTKKGGSYQANLKRAGKMYREGKIGGRKKSRSSSNSRKSGSVRKSKSPFHRMGALERPENLSSTVAAARHALHVELGWKLAAQRTAKTKKEKRGLQPQINDLTRKLKALKG